MKLKPCVYRRCDEEAIECQLVANVLRQHGLKTNKAAKQEFETKNADSNKASLAIVNEKTCQVCGDFFPPSLRDWNPIIASLLLTAAEKTKSNRLAELAYEELWHTQTGGYLDLGGQLQRDQSTLPRCEYHRSDGSRKEPGKRPTCLHFVRKHEQLIGTNAHRSGWPFAIEAIKSLQCTDGILFDDFVEQRFCYQVGSPGYRERWIGIFHHPPPSDPHFLGSRFALAPLFDTKIWRDTAPYLTGAIALTEHLACYLRDRLQIPVEVVKHPGETVGVAQWSEERFLQTKPRQLVQLGWFGRNTQAIYQMRPHRNYTYVRVLPSGRHYEKYESQLRDFNDARNLATVHHDGVVDRTRFSDLELQAAHTSHVFVTEMLSASANNAVLDCIASCSPLLINRHPAVVEYLGPQYPLYFDDIRTAHKLLDDDNVVAAHRYLKQADRSWMRGDSFRTAMTRAISSLHQQATK